LFVELPPCQRHRLVPGPGQKLIAQRRTVGKGPRRGAQHLVQGGGHIARLPGHLVLDVEHVLPRCKAHRFILPGSPASPGRDACQVTQCPRTRHGASSTRRSCAPDARRHPSPQPSSSPLPRHPRA
jgi:hypothetical protein